MTSARVAGFSLNRPRTAEVTVSVPGLRTPRIDMQRCSASIITNAPRGASAATIASAICVVSRSCTCGRFANPSTSRANFDKPGDATVVSRDVRDVRAPVERNEVVLADRVQRDVAHEHHLVVVGLERDDEMARRILRQAGADLRVHLGDARRRAQQAVAVGIFADRGEDLAHGLLDAIPVDRTARVRNRAQRVASRSYGRLSIGGKLACVLRDERQVAIALVDVEAVADHEPVGNA